MIQKFRKLSLESQLFFSFMAVSVCLLLLSLSITLFSTITRQRQEIDKNISALAAMKLWIPCLKIFPISMS